MYNPTIEELFHHPKHGWPPATSAGEDPYRAEWNGQLWSALAHWSTENPICGDEVELILAENCEKRRRLFHRSKGCPPVLAMAELLCRTAPLPPSQTAPANSKANVENRRPEPPNVDSSSWLDQLEQLHPLPPNKKHALSMGKQLMARWPQNLSFSE